MQVSYKFYINNNGSKSTSKEKPIYLYVRHKLQTLALNTFEKIEPKFWDAKNQKVKTSYVGSPELNNLLEKKLERVKALKRNAEIENENITFAELKEIIKQSLSDKPACTFESVYNDYMLIKISTTSPALQRKLKTVLKHLKSYDSKIQLNSFTALYLQKFKNYLISKELSNAYICKTLQFLNGFLLWAYENDFLKNDSFKKFKNVGKATPPKFALNRADLQKILSVSLPERLERVRDLFLFQLYSGQRFSDVQRFEYADVENDVWILRQKKTATVVRIPLIEPAIRIIEKYNYVLPTITNQKCNEFLKEIAVIADLDDEISVYRENGINRTEIKQSKAELLCTHTARRTAITLLTNGKVSETLIKNISGHSSDKMLNQYYDRSDVSATKSALEKVFNFADNI